MASYSSCLFEVNWDLAWIKLTLLGGNEVLGKVLGGGDNRPGGRDWSNLKLEALELWIELAFGYIQVETVAQRHWPGDCQWHFRDAG